MLRLAFLLVALGGLVACDSPGSTEDTAPDAMTGTSDGPAVDTRDTVTVDVMIGALSSRRNAAAAVDPRTGTLYLSGGATPEGQKLGEIHQWTGTGWQQLTDAMPPEARHGFVYSPAHEAFVVLGSNSSVGWHLWDPAAPTQHEDLTVYCNDGCPLGRVGHATSYLPATDSILLFSGVGGAANSIGAFLRQDAYLLTGTADRWTSPAGPTPPARTGAAIAYNPGDGAIYMFGGLGEDQYSPLNDLWKLDENGWQLVQENAPLFDAEFATSDRPGGRHGATFTFHPGLNKLVLVGGYHPWAPGAPFYEQTLGYWTWDGAAWKRLASGPSVDVVTNQQNASWTYHHAAAYDAETEAIIVVGGMEGPMNTRLLRFVE